jgi:tetratricopeptide (TPR) repeat protein
MSEALVNKLLPVLEKIPWPADPQANQVGEKSYAVGLERVNAYRDDPKVLADALRLFQTGQSRPFAFAGAAYTLLAAAREEGGRYSQAGLEAALVWLEKAQELEPDNPSINFVEALIYIHGGRTEDARTILDYLMEQDPANQYVLEAKALYWQQIGEADEAVRCYQAGIEAAVSVPLKLRLCSKLADCYLAFGRYQEAAGAYTQAIYFDQQNAWLWHQQSVAYWNLGNYEEAARANRRALALQDLPEARQMMAALKEKRGAPGGLGRLFGR